MNTDRERAMPGGSRRLLPFKSMKDIWPDVHARPESLGLLVLSAGSALQVQGIDSVKSGLSRRGYGVERLWALLGQSVQTPNVQLE